MLELTGGVAVGLALGAILLAAFALSLYQQWQQAVQQLKQEQIGQKMSDMMLD